jgi:hypothetical protein
LMHIPYQIKSLRIKKNHTKIMIKRMREKIEIKNKLDGIKKS